eukprot:gene9850-2173_t
MKTIYLYLLFTLAFSVYSHSHFDVLRKNIHSKYKNSVKLDENYTLLWKLSNQNKTVNFAIDCKTTGWVGVGFSLHGKMAPSSDFFMAYIDTKGKVHASDRYSLSRVEPKTDVELGGTEDFKLVSGREENGRYLFEFSRDAVTKDRFDIPIQLEGHTNLIWAYSDKKPVNIGDPLSFHNRFGSIEVTFGEPARERPLPDKDVVKTPIQFDNYKLTGKHTEYVCKNFKYSELGLNTESHAVKFEPIIDNAQVLHHIVIYECDFNVNTSAPVFDCINDMPRCEFSYIWAIGAKSFYTPKEAGIRVAGRKLDNIILQIHYDNRDEDPKHIDSSGIMMYSTPHFRRYDAGVLSLGVPLGQIRIPPKQQQYSISNICQNSCSTDKIFLFGYLLHMHLIGSEIETRIHRNGREIKVIELKDWDFDRQEQVALEEEFPIYKDDLFFTKCNYNSMSRTNVTRGGLPSTDEMCYNFLSYYPKNNGPAHCYGHRCIGWNP